MTPKRGLPNSLTPAVEAEMERLWTRTAVPQAEIADRLNAAHGTAFEGKNVEWHARRRCWSRDMISQSINHRSVVEERLHTASLLRSSRIPNAGDVVRLVAPGSFPARAGGFSMIGGGARG